MNQDEKKCNTNLKPYNQIKLAEVPDVAHGPMKKNFYFFKNLIFKE